MTNTDRLAQALRRMDEAYCEAGDHMIEAREALAEHDALGAPLAAMVPSAWMHRNNKQPGVLFSDDPDEACVWSSKEDAEQSAREASYPDDDYVRTAVPLYTAAQVAALTAQCEGMRKDAERYRWLRRTSGKQFTFLAHYSLFALDEQVDAAIAAGNGECV